MKIVQINAVCGMGSTGGITIEISKMLNAHNIENYIFYTYGKYDYEQGIKYSSNFYIKLNAVLARVFGNYGFNSRLSTGKLIRKLKEIKPDIVHLHNIHGHDVNLKEFFCYLKESGVRVIWTFHDCWAFTGYCMHFDLLKCPKWQKLCKECPQKKQYSIFCDKSEKLFLAKKELFNGIDDMTIVTPSEWMAALTKHSFMNKIPVQVINNGVDLDVFHLKNTNIRQKLGLDDKYVVLGIPKGELERFLELADKMDNKYQLLLVGLSKKELKRLPGNVLGMGKVQNRETMAEIFCASNVFVNMTMQDTFPTVNLESLACGTPVITFNTGGSPEAVDDETGAVVEKENIAELYKSIQEICNGPDRSEACIKRAKSLYNANERFADYLDLYLKRGRFE